jgi:hypothetical protein
MGKGSRRRPCLVSREQFERNWERAFGRKEKQPRMKHGTNTEGNHESTKTRNAPAPKGPDSIAQGNALGAQSHKTSAPQGRNKRKPMP